MGVFIITSQRFKIIPYIFLLSTSRNYSIRCSFSVFRDALFSCFTCAPYEVLNSNGDISDLGAALIMNIKCNDKEDSL
jgi:hypothetical protein